MLYMGYTKSRGKCHFIKIESGFERRALCGALVERFVTRYFDKEEVPVPYASHWGGRYYNCQHCEYALSKLEGVS